MLQELKIENLALVEALHLKPEGGLVVLTGETGAGKSIILQAIHLLCGGRADSSWVRTGTDESLVEALFEYPVHSGVPSLLVEKGIPEDDCLIIRRFISSKGKSRFYINGAMATAKIVAEIAENLLCVASQHDHQQLLQAAQHLDVLDLVGDLHGLRAEMEQAYDSWQAALLEFKDLESRKRERLQRQDLLAFQCREIEDSSLTAGEDEHLELEKNRLRSSEQLRSLGGESYRMLEDSVVPGVQQCRKELERMVELDATVSSLAERIAGAGYELEDCLAVLRTYMEELPSNPQQLEIVAERIHQINLLKKKYGPAIEDILAYEKKAADELVGLGHLEEDLEILEKSCLKLEKEAVAKGRELSAKRKEVAVVLEKKLMRELASLSLENAVFSVVFHQQQNDGSASLRRHGFDVPEFYFSANPGEPAKPLARVASGGELSRLMLALRCILARQDRVETVIFDEIDAGVSGKAAERVALKIKELAAHHQVLCITHLPQIASRADAHYRVDKKIIDRRTKTSIARLSEEERAGELARMLDGTIISEKTLDYARELLARNKALNSAGQVS